MIFWSPYFPSVVVSSLPTNVHTGTISKITHFSHPNNNINVNNHHNHYNHHNNHNNHNNHSFIRMDCKHAKEQKCKCRQEVKALYQKAACHDHPCHKKTNASLFSCRKINLYLQSLKSGYGTESQQGITTEPNALNDVKDYLVCANLKNILRHHKKQERGRVLIKICRKLQMFYYIVEWWSWYVCKGIIYLVLSLKITSDIPLHIRTISVNSSRSTVIFSQSL